MIGGVFTVLACFVTYKLTRQADARKERKDEDHLITTVLGEIRMDIAVIKTVISDFETVKAQQKEDHDRIVVSELRITKNGDDVNAQHSKIRKCETRCDDIDQAISSIGRL